MKMRRDDDGRIPNAAPREGDESLKLWGIFIFGVIGTFATAFAVLVIRGPWLHSQIPKSQQSRQSRKSYSSAFREETWRRYHRQLQEQCEEDLERLEQLRRMQRIFERERNKYRMSYNRWGQNDPGAYHQHFQWHDWYWTDDSSFKGRWNNYREILGNSASHSLTHHYSVLGLDRSRAKPYTEAEIKAAFWAKAKEVHPDRNHDNKEAAEAKFKEVMMSYEAIKQELGRN